MEFEKVYLNEYGFYELKQKPSIEDRKNEFENEYYQNSMASYSSKYSEEELKMFNIANKRKEMIINEHLQSLEDLINIKKNLLNYKKKIPMFFYMRM